jgi:hypothetical protein
VIVQVRRHARAVCSSTAGTVDSTEHQLNFYEPMTRKSHMFDEPVTLLLSVCVCLLNFCTISLVWISYQRLTVLFSVNDSPICRTEWSHMASLPAVAG